MGIFVRKQTKTSVTKTGSNSKKTPLINEDPVDPGYGNDPEEGDADVGFSTLRNVEVETKIPDSGWKTCCKCSAPSCCIALPAISAMKALQLTALGVGAVGLILILLFVETSDFGKDLNVAFIGNSYFYVNDLPRLVESISSGHIHQDSCLHTSGSILNILKTGNGMYKKWQTQNAMINGVEWLSPEDGTVSYLYDMGACSVPELLTGHDRMLSYGNQYGHYINDGGNPCLVDNNYLDYQESYNYTEPWDYVVMTDQSKRMSFDEARYEALMAFNYTYAPILAKNGGVPVIVQPHAFWSENANMTGLEDVPTFTGMIREGAEIYKDFLDARLPAVQATRIAPVGDAFLTVYNEDPDMWKRLFLGDEIHPSGLGSFLYANVIYATIYRVTPDTRIFDDVAGLFSTARKIHSNETQLPTLAEAKYLYKVARNVALLGQKPTGYKIKYEDDDDEVYDYVPEATNDATDDANKNDDYYAVVDGGNNDDNYNSNNDDGNNGNNDDGNN